MIKRKYDLGDELKDNVTGFVGVALAYTRYATGCVHYGLQAKLTKSTEEPVEWQWFDQARLALKKKKAVKFEIEEPTSGIFPSPPSM